DQIHRAGPAERQTGRLRRRFQTGDAFEAYAGRRRRLARGGRRGYLSGRGPQGRPVHGLNIETPRKGVRREKSMRRVVVTGMGIVSSIGNSTQEVTASL